MSAKTKIRSLVDGKEVGILYFGIFIVFFLMIVLGNFPAFQHERWKAGMDLTKDGMFSLADIFKWILWIFFMPGDVLIQGVLVSPTASKFFEVTTDSYGKIASTAFSLAFWYLAGGKKLLKCWAVILLIIILSNLPGVPLLY